MQENEPQKLVEKVAGDIESLLDRKVQALKVGAGVGLRGGPGGGALRGPDNVLARCDHTALLALGIQAGPSEAGQCLPGYGQLGQEQIVISGRVSIKMIWGLGGLMWA